MEDATVQKPLSKICANEIDARAHLRTNQPGYVGYSCTILYVNLFLSTTYLSNGYGSSHYLLEVIGSMNGNPLVRLDH